jgi:phage terminase small subunit
MPLNPKQRRFVAEYLLDLNATEAAKRTGYAPNSAGVTASRLLSDAKISAAIAEGQAKQLNRADLTAARVLEELRRLAFADTRAFFDAAGNLKPIHELTPEQGSQLAGLEVIKKNAEAGDGHIDIVHKIKLWDKTRSLEMLCKRFGLLTERLELNGALEVRWKD